MKSANFGGLLDGFGNVGFILFLSCFFGFRIGFVVFWLLLVTFFAYCTGYLVVMLYFYWGS